MELYTSAAWYSFPYIVSYIRYLQFCARISAFIVASHYIYVCHLYEESLFWTTSWCIIIALKIMCALFLNHCWNNPLQNLGWVDHIFIWQYKTSVKYIGSKRSQIPEISKKLKQIELCEKPYRKIPIFPSIAWCISSIFTYLFRLYKYFN